MTTSSLATLSNSPNLVQSTSPPRRIWRLNPYPAVVQKLPALELIQSNQSLVETISWQNLKKLTWLSHSKSSHYTISYIAKKNGAKRKIFNPSPLLRIAQYRILNSILDHFPIPDYVHGFEKGKSVATMAALHIGKPLIISLDIKSFFDSIKQYMVYQILCQAGMHHDPASLVSELLTYKFYVPQGSITAPKVSNIICSTTFGPVIKEYCDANNLTLTIYADDITVSTDRQFETPEVRREFVKNTIDFIKSSVKNFGFQINSKKTKVMRPHVRQWVCGAVVNTKVNLMKKQRLKLRAIVHNITKNGLEAELVKTKANPVNFIRKYRGQLNWFAQLNPQQGNPLKEAFMQATRNYLRQYPEIVIPEESWNSGIEMKYEIKPSDLVMQDI